MTRYPSLAASARLAAADARPEPALVEGAIAWTWRELDERADAIAGELLRAGIRPASRVAMICPGNSANPPLPGVGFPVSSRGTCTHS